MSLFTSILKPILERELDSLEPEAAAFILRMLKTLSSEALYWAEQKINFDINGDGHIGAPQDDA